MSLIVLSSSQIAGQFEFELADSHVCLMRVVRTDGNVEETVKRSAEFRSCKRCGYFMDRHPVCVATVVA